MIMSKSQIGNNLGHVHNHLMFYDFYSNNLGNNSG